MNAIIGYTNLAMKEDVSPTVQEYLDKIDASSQHLLALINDILEMSRIESGKLELEYAPVDLRGVFEGIGDLFHEQMGQKGIDFSVHTGQVTNRYRLVRQEEPEPRAAEPREQRLQVHARGRHDLVLRLSNRPTMTATAPMRSACRTPASACPRSSSTRCSTPSSASAPPPTAAWRAPAWAWPSRSASWT